MRKKILLLTALAILASTTFLLPNLSAKSEPLGGGKWWERPAIKENLQLTDQQKETINRIWTEYRKRIIDTRADIEKTYLDLENLMGKPAVDKQEAYQLAERLAQLHRQQAEQRIKMTIDIRQELSAEQFEKLKGMRAAWTKTLGEKRSKDPRRRKPTPE